MSINEFHENFSSRVCVNVFKALSLENGTIPSLKSRSIRIIGRQTCVIFPTFILNEFAEKMNNGKLQLLIRCRLNRSIPSDEIITKTESSITTNRTLLGYSDLNISFSH